MVLTEGKVRILVDTNALIDFIVGMTAAYCTNVMDALKRILSLLDESGATLVLSEKSIEEFRRVLRKPDVSKTLRVCVGNPEDIVNCITRCEGSGVEIIHVNEGEERDVRDRYAAVLKSSGVRFPTEDAHILAVLIKSRPKYFVSRDEKVYQAANIISAKERLGVAVKRFKGLVDSLLQAGVINIRERYIIGYKAYELQILPFTHRNAYECGHASDRNSLEYWVRYSQKNANRIHTSQIPWKKNRSHGGGNPEATPHYVLSTRKENKIPKHCLTWHGSRA